MKLVRLAAVTLAVSATTALAQPGAAPGVDNEPPPAVIVLQPAPAAPAAPAAAQPAPQNEDWRNVSHINGTPVKVGERGDYLYEYKKTNIASNPIGWMLGFYGLSVSHAMSENIALRADGNLFDIDGETGYELGLTAPIYFRRVYQGPFLEGGVMVRRFDEKDCDYSGENCMAADASVGPQIMVGWHWTFDSGANVAFAVGAFRPMGQGKTADDVEPAGYLRIGYAY